MAVINVRPFRVKFHRQLPSASACALHVPASTFFFCFPIIIILAAAAAAAENHCPAGGRAVQGPPLSRSHPRGLLQHSSSPSSCRDRNISRRQSPLISFSLSGRRALLSPVMAAARRRASLLSHMHNDEEEEDEDERRRTDTFLTFLIFAPSVRPRWRGRIELSTYAVGGNALAGLEALS